MLRHLIIGTMGVLIKFWTPVVNWLMKDLSRSEQYSEVGWSITSEN
jgi:hypothetical protein